MVMSESRASLANPSEVEKLAVGASKIRVLSRETKIGSLQSMSYMTERTNLVKSDFLPMVSSVSCVLVIVCPSPNE